MAQNTETSTDRDGNEISVETPNIAMPKIRGMQGQTWTETIRTDDLTKTWLFLVYLQLQNEHGTVQAESLTGLLA